MQAGAAKASVKDTEMNASANDIEMRSWLLPFSFKGNVLNLKAVRVACDAGACLTLWELRHLYDASSMFGSQTLLHRWIARRGPQWKRLHEKLWPGIACPDIF